MEGSLLEDFETMGEVLLLHRPHRCSPLAPPDGQVDTFVPKSNGSGRPETRHFQDFVIFRLPCRYACTPRTINPRGAWLPGASLAPRSQIAIT